MTDAIHPERITAAAILESGVVYTGPHHATIIHYRSAAMAHWRT
jgi:hypothetical protein